MLKWYCTPATTSCFMKFYFVSRSKVRLMKNSTPNVGCLARHYSNLWINLWLIWKQVNHNMNNHYMLFKRITLSFVYFWKVISFRLLMLHITSQKHHIGNIFQILNKSRQQQTCKNSWAANSLESLPPVII